LSNHIAVRILDEIAHQFEQASARKGTDHKSSNTSGMSTKMSNNRDNFTEPVKRNLAERVAFKCSNPECRASTMGPARGDQRSVNLGVAAHITAAARNGPRYDENKTADQRSAAENGIWLCQICGRLVDADDSAHTVDQLLTWRQGAEYEAKARLGVPKANSHFRLLPGDQTVYLNARRFVELLNRAYIDVRVNQAHLNTRLLDMENFVRLVMEYEAALKKLYPESLELSALKTETDLKLSVGHLISFTGEFKSKNAPRIGATGDFPIYHPVGDLEKDHHLYKDFGQFKLALPLDSLWYASNSALGFLRGSANKSIRGLARVHSFDDGVMIASPVWLALPGLPGW
jgi:hypothetical protein